ncbi:hypothetical protein REPUB_Repub02eG0007700 [Reevesia pubescens]
MQSVIHANQCLDLMECRRVGRNDITYSELLKFAVWQENLFAVHEIWKDYIKHYCQNIISLRKFIWCFTRLKDLRSAYEALQDMVALAISGKLFVSRTGERRLYFSRLDFPIPSKGELGSQKVKLGENEQSLALKFGTDASNIEKYKSECYARDYELAEQLMVLMQNLGLQPSSYTFDGFVRAVIPTRGFSAGMKVEGCLKVMEERNMKPHASTLSALSVQFSKELELDLAEALLDQVCKCPHPYPYNAFLGACDTMDQPERAVWILAKMRQLKLLPDIRTYELLFSLFGNVNAPYEEGNILSQLKALGAEGMTRELLQYLHVAKNLFCHTNTYLGAPIYSTVLHSLVEAEESHKAIEIFKNMKSRGFRPNAATYNIMIDCCSTMRCFKSACALVSMMVRDGFYPETMTYTALIKDEKQVLYTFSPTQNSPLAIFLVLLDYENFEALNLQDLASLEGYQLDVLLYNTILKKASEKGRIDIMEFILGRMHQDKVQHDPSTCHYVFSAYVDRGFHNTAMEALQVLSMWMICDEDSTLEEKKREFEDGFVLYEDLEAESRILQVFKD